MKEVSVSFLKKGNYSDYIKQINDTNADYIHFDVMDGKFVENKNLSVKELTNLIGLSNKKNDIHLMVKKPEKYIEALSTLNVNNITIHYEIKNLDRFIDQIKSYGIKVGIALNPNTDVDKIRPYLNKINTVLLMSVYPGKSGQTFIEDTEFKIKELKRIISEENINVKIEVDGGISSSVLGKIKEADILVSASFLLDDLSRIDILKNN